MLKKATSLRLDHDPYWSALLHSLGRNSDFIKSEQTSQVISPSFFLSGKGRVRFDLELAATLEAILKPPGDNSNTHAQCRFPARFGWLKKKLKLDPASIPDVVCDDYLDWKKAGNTQTVSLFLVTGYLENPASFFGHILLRFNSRQSLTSSDLLATSLDYGAIITNNDNGLLYILKGIFGGYDAGFTDGQFYKKNHGYGDKELRDMWEYQLNLSDDEVSQLVAHAWELLGNKFVYYFTKENCAFAMAELLELIVEEPLYSRNIPWVVPHTVFDHLMRAERNGSSLVSSVNYHPSRFSRFVQNFRELSTNEQIIARDYSNGVMTLENKRYLHLSALNKAKVLDVLLEYIQYRIEIDEDTTELDVKRRLLLLERLSLPASGRPRQTPGWLPKPPHLGQRATTTRISAVYNNEHGMGALFQLRPVYFDFLSSDIGRSQNSELSMFDFKFEIFDSKLSLRSITLINLENLNTSLTGMAQDGGFAWKLRAAYENQDLSCQNCQVLRGTLGIGKAFSFSTEIIGFAMMDAHVQSKFKNSGNFVMSPRLGALINVSDWWKSSISYKYNGYIDGTIRDFSSFRWKNRFGTGRDWDIRISYEDDNEKEVQLTWSQYW
jgi:hypothetical protein